MLIFAADHGIAEEGISIAPSSVTQQMVLNFLNGGAAINCFCRTNKMSLEIIDAGILSDIEDPRLTKQSLGSGTRNFSQFAAMEKSAVEKGLQLGANAVYKHVKSGCNIIGFGEMGIGNTSSAAAIMAAILNYSVKNCVGRRTGINDTILNKKVLLIEKSIQLHKNILNSPIDIMACFGGYEIVQMVGAMLAAAEKKCLLLVDGFISSIAALLAYKINSHALDYIVFCHQSNEQGHHLILEYLKVTPLLTLDLRLGEGTGAAPGTAFITGGCQFL